MSLSEADMFIYGYTYKGNLILRKGGHFLTTAR